MNGKSKKIPVNYSVKNIIYSILEDNPKARKYSDAKKKKLYNNCLNYLNKCPELKKILSIAHIRKYPVKGVNFFARIGVIPPELVIVDERIKNMCTLPYWTLYNDKKGNIYRGFGKCPGHGWLPSCPPNSPSVEKVQKILDQSDFFIVLQTKLLSERGDTMWKFTVLHRLAHEIEKVLGKKSVTGKYGSGPCTACKSQNCIYNKPCKSPELKTISLESMGICVERLCTDLALLTGQNAWKITWLKHFGLPQQTPKKWKYVEAISVKMPKVPKVEKDRMQNSGVRSKTGCCP